jgi:uncharacterized protein YjbI with pentapeptide repeats
MTTRNGKQRGAQRNPARPPQDLRAGAPALASDTTLERVQVTGEIQDDDTADGPVLTDVDLADLRWTDGRLPGRHFRRLRCRNAVFDRCDLSGVVLEDSTLKRVEFHDCRMSGMVFAGATLLEDVLFTGCKLNLANLRMARGRRLEFLGSDLGEADLYATEFTATRVRGCDLSGAQLSEAELAGLRLHGCVLHDLRGVSALRGAIVSRDQVMDIAMALFAASGIVVDDDG